MPHRFVEFLGSSERPVVLSVKHVVAVVEIDSLTTDIILRNGSSYCVNETFNEVKRKLDS